MSNNSAVVSKRTSLEYWVMTNSYEYYTLENGGNQKKKKDMLHEKNSTSEKGLHHITPIDGINTLHITVGPHLIYKKLHVVHISKGRIKSS